MPYIYKIENLLNHKIYIGKTVYSIEKRWQEHCHDAITRTKEHRPLYAAMNKYGIDNFSICLVEECDYTILNEREQYWIAQYNSYNYGYNATLGGDGRTYLDYNQVYETYLQCQENCLKTASVLNIDASTVSNIVKQMGGTIHHGGEHQSKMINMYDLNGNYLRTFVSAREAARFLASLRNEHNSNESGHIIEVCKGKRKTCQGYIWRYASS